MYYPKRSFRNIISRSQLTLLNGQHMSLNKRQVQVHFFGLTPYPSLLDKNKRLCEIISRTNVHVIIHKSHIFFCFHLRTLTSLSPQQEKPPFGWRPDRKQPEVKHKSHDVTFLQREHSENTLDWL